MAIFKELLNSIDCYRLKMKFEYEYDFVEKLFLSNSHERYDSLLEKYAITMPRDQFISNMYEEYGRDVLLPTIFKLLERKKLLILIDLYLKDCKDDNQKIILLNEKYMILARDENLENWYFGYGDDVSCMLVDVDYIVADSFGIPLDYYLVQKNDYFAKDCDEMTKKALGEDLKISNLRVVYESFLMAVLLNMDLKTLNGSYKVFRNASLDGKYDGDNVDFIEGVYSKYLTLVKKLKED
jgi:hypothetical protein